MKKAIVLIVLAFILVDLGDGVIGDGFHPGSASPSFHFIKPSLYHPPLLPIKLEIRGETTFIEIFPCENLKDPRHAERNQKRGLLRAPPGFSRQVPVKNSHTEVGMKQVADCLEKAIALTEAWLYSQLHRDMEQESSIRAICRNWWKPSNPYA